MHLHKYNEQTPNMLSLCVQISVFYIRSFQLIAIQLKQSLLDLA